MRIFDIFFKNIREISKDKHNLFFVLIFPTISLIFVGLIVGGGVVDNTAHIGILDLDNSEYSSSLINEIETISFDNKTNVFNVVHLKNAEEGDKKLEDSSISAYLTIPENYSDIIFINETAISLPLKGNPSSIDYIMDESILKIIFLEYSMDIQDFNYIDIKTVSNNALDDFNAFNYMVPGLLVFGLLMTINSIAMNLSKESENGMLKRMKLTKMTSKDYVFGNLLTWLAIGVAQAVILIVIAISLGFEWQGGIYAIILAGVIGILTMMSSIAVAIMIVSVTKTTSQAGGLATLVSFSLSFASESYMLGGDNAAVFMPWSQAVDALTQVLIYGKGISHVYPNIGLITVSGTAMLVIAVMLFNRKINSDL